MRNDGRTKGLPVGGGSAPSTARARRRLGYSGVWYGQIDAAVVWSFNRSFCSCSRSLAESEGAIIMEFDCDGASLGEDGRSVGQSG